MLEELERVIQPILEQLQTGNYRNISPPRYMDLIFAVSAFNEIKYAIQHQEGTQWRAKAENFLRRRFNAIRNTRLCPSLNREWCVNAFCAQLAEFVDAEHVMQQLLPSVSAYDVYGNELGELGAGNFIVSDDGDVFISIEDVIDTATERWIESTPPYFVTLSADGQTRPLSESEFSRLGGLGDFVKQRLEEIKPPNQALAGVYQRLLRLRNGLLAGDAGHGGQELNAGADGIVAIAEFNEYYASLSTEQQQMISQIRGRGAGTLGQVFNRLFRDPGQLDHETGQEVRFCLQIIGGQLEDIIRENRTRLGGFTERQVAAIRSISVDAIRLKSNGTLSISHGLKIKCYNAHEIYLADAMIVMLSTDKDLDHSLQDANNRLTVIDIFKVFKPLLLHCALFPKLRIMKKSTCALLQNFCADVLQFEHRGTQAQILIIHETVKRLCAIFTALLAQFKQPLSPKEAGLLKAWLLFKRSHPEFLDIFETVTEAIPSGTFTGRIATDEIDHSRESEMQVEQHQPSEMTQRYLALIEQIKSLLRETINRLNKKVIVGANKVRYLTQLLNAITRMETSLNDYSEAIQKSLMNEMLARTALLMACKRYRLEVGTPKTLNDWTGFVSSHQTTLDDIVSVSRQLLKPVCTIRDYEVYMASDHRRHDQISNTPIDQAMQSRQAEEENEYSGLTPCYAEADAKATPLLVTQGYYARQKRNVDKTAIWLYIFEQNERALHILLRLFPDVVHTRSDKKFHPSSTEVNRSIRHIGKVDKSLGSFFKSMTGYDHPSEMERTGIMGQAASAGLGLLISPVVLPVIFGTIATDFVGFTNSNFEHVVYESMTPLDYALSIGAVGIAACLLAHGADPQIVLKHIDKKLAGKDVTDKTRRTCSELRLLVCSETREIALTA